ncbi:hypothetical protein [Streptomyces spiramyceticus]|uniref:hypothetical protein n=1 Tax=Streptomyces spiramyceticus TaxID=299717 RepID=UPI00237A26AB|nr:hypothetical protein [Streptomyces spiramyceticus]
MAVFPSGQVTCSRAQSMVKSSAVNPPPAAAWWLTTPATGPVRVRPYWRRAPTSTCASTYPGLQHQLTGAAINLARLDAHLTETPRARTRTSHFAALRPAEPQLDGPK